MATRPQAGFGVPESEIDPQHFIVRISENARTNVAVIEDFGISGPKLDVQDNAYIDQIERCSIHPRRWRMVATPLKNTFNERLKSRKYRPGRWATGDNRVHRLLGREMSVLLWAVEQCDESLVPAAINAWLGLRPEERWWLYAMAAHSSGKSGDHDRGWRKAIRFGLTEGAPLPDSYRSNFLDQL
jgi:hypothetical protein